MVLAPADPSEETESKAKCCTAGLRPEIEKEGLLPHTMNCPADVWLPRGLTHVSPERRVPQENTA